MRPILLTLLLAACGNGDGIVVVTLNASTAVANIAALRTNASIGGKSSVHTNALATPINLPPATMFALQIPASLGGHLVLTVDALDANGATLASAGSEADVTAGGRTTMNIVFGVSATDGSVILDLAAADLTPSGADFAFSDAGCPALVGETCTGANELRRCAADGVNRELVTCAEGCASTPSPHCKLLTPTGAIPPSDLNVVGLINGATTGTSTWNTDTGAIGGVRAGNSNPAALEVVSGIGFHVVGPIGSQTGVFIFDGVDTGSPSIIGKNALGIVSKGMVSINSLSLQNCSVGTPPAGGFAGAAPGSPDGAGPGGGHGGAVIATTNRAGSGGGGHFTAGGAGIANGGAAGGAGGSLYGDDTITLLRGGSGGGTSAGGTVNGGNGGGAVQVVSTTGISIGAAGLVNAGGCGGGGSSGVSTGGGGAGGAILLEAPTVSFGISSAMSTSGGGGGCGDGGGSNGGTSPSGDSLGGFCSGTPTRCGGGGGGSNGSLCSTGISGSGGGSSGYVRVNTRNGTADFSPMQFSPRGHVTTGTLNFQ